ncbi:hypothetical protein CY35_15G002200 [Sphagnum magellanicum]|nr:hypothetical protein CY35_15G002200 [Sphagnum magellanicum]
MQNLSDAGPSCTSLQRLCCIVDFREKELAELRRLLQLGGADPNLEDTFQRSSLFLLCMHSGHYEAAETLLAVVVGNRTSLHWCSDRGWLATAQLLITNGALVNATTKQGDSALLWAAKAGHGNLVEQNPHSHPNPDSWTSGPSRLIPARIA